MKLNLQQWSLKTRITLFTLIIFVASIWSLSFYASKVLQHDVQQLLGDQQFSTVTFVAAEVEEQLNDRFQYLQSISSALAPAMLNNHPALQAWLEQKKVLGIMFNAGSFFTNLRGDAIASVPVELGRVGTNYLDRDYVIAALQKGESTVGKPILGRKLNSPVVVMAVPVRDAQGKIVGAMAGVIDLGRPNFLENITNASYGKSGGFVLLAPKHRLIVTATDKSRIMQALPAPGVVPTLDRFLDGYEGSAIYVNPLGVEVLGSAKSIPAAAWLLGVTLPTAEALAPIRSMQQRVLLVAIFLTLLAGALTWWMIKRQLSPMLLAVETMKSWPDAQLSTQALPVAGQDEIATLIKGFNGLLGSVEQKQVMLRSSELQARSVIELSPVPLAINDDHGNISYLNQAFIKTLGYTLEDIPTLEEWWPRAYPDAGYRKFVADLWLQRLEQVRHSKQAFVPLEINISCKDSSLRTFLVSAAAFGDESYKNHMVILYDITERKLAESELIVASERLKEAQHIAHIGNWSLDLVSGKLLWSDEIFEMFEIDHTKFGATYEAFLNAIHPDDREAVNQAYSNSLVTRQPYEITHRLKMSDGRIKWVMEKCNSDFDAAGKPLQSRGMVQDITRLKQVELELVAARDLAERASKAKSEFLSSMSHELRTPMNAILGFAQVLDYDPNLAEEYRVSVKEILSAGFHLIELINEVLDLSQIETGNLNLLMESVEICTVVEESIKLVSVLADKRKIKVTHAGLEGVTVKADRIRLKQALLNLLSNAIKYNREGGSVSIEVRPQGANRLRIRVRDTGMGIPPAQLQDVFQAFNRLGAENSNVMGAGIGLTITRRIVEMMGGTVAVESEVGVGSLFWIELPIEFMPLRVEEHPARQSKDKRAQGLESAKYNVLYIEDNPSNLRLVAQLFGQRKYIHLITAHTPELGIDLAIAQRPDLILLDINMSGMSGYQVLEVFKHDEHLQNVPVIAVTAAAMPSEIEQGLAAGFTEYLTKPLDIANFYNVIDRYLSVLGHRQK